MRICHRAAKSDRLVAKIDFAFRCRVIGLAAHVLTCTLRCSALTLLGLLVTFSSSLVCLALPRLLAVFSSSLVVGSLFRSTRLPLSANAGSKGKGPLSRFKGLWGVPGGLRGKSESPWPPEPSETNPFSGKSQVCWGGGVPMTACHFSLLVCRQHRRHLAVLRLRLNRPCISPVQSSGGRAKKRQNGGYKPLSFWVLLMRKDGKRAGRPP